MSLAASRRQRSPCGLRHCAVLVASAVVLVASMQLVGAEIPAVVDEVPVTDADRKHWAFTPLVRPEIPETADAAWPQNPIDNFVLARIQRRRLAPTGRADRETLIRRVCLNLVGIPPTPTEVDAFLADERPGAYERAVDRLLASPQYGERWGQHWLDLARYADTDGFEHDLVRPNSWQFRDWVIRALNDDMPYDQFIAWQIAGDVLAPENEDAVTATAFCLSGPDMPDINSQEERKQTLLNEMTATLGSVVLGLQFGCAQCHDHKFDPLSQGDFYRLRAFFTAAVQVEAKKSVGTLTAAIESDEPSYLLVRGDWRRPGPPVKADFPRIANPVQAVVAERDPGAQRAELARWLTRDDHPLTARVIVNRIWQHHFGRGIVATPSDFGIMGEEPTHPELLDWLACELVAGGWRLKRLHRLIVTSATYRQAGRRDLETAVDTWQRKLAADAHNRLLARFPRQRIDAEIVRDAMLAASGSLNSQAGGPGVMPPLPQELVQTLLKKQWQTSPRPEDHYRRSVYLFARRNLRYPLFEALDRPAADASCARRPRTTTANQALMMLNSQFSLEAARRLAGFVWGQVGSEPADQVQLAYRRVLCRLPRAEELSEAVEFLAQQRTLIQAELANVDDLAAPIGCLNCTDPYAGAALTDLCLALFNTNAFLYVD